MPLAPGHRLGNYQIVGTLGAGGMGEVYRARDTTLQRDVAIKVLPDVCAGDPQRLQRMTREARALAALNHPNIAHIHGLDDTGSGRALVMELVEGDDLSDRIARGPLPRAAAIRIARQIAEALEAAHEEGIVHRDLKPANVKVRRDGTVKVLDFGLAKVAAPETDASTTDGGATFTADHSEPGIVLGTAAYMAPEQARGQAVDKRADIWAFGAVLYEMLTGTRAFGGQRTADVLAAVVRREIDWSRLPDDLPAALRHLLERCLTIEVKDRLRDIGEARVALAEMERGPEKGDRSSPRPDTRNGAVLSARFKRVLFVAVATIVAVAVFQIARFMDAGDRPSSPGTSRWSLLPPPGLRFSPESSNVAMSPDGRTLAFVVGTGIAAENQLWVRSVDSLTARRIESGDGVSLPFWSPDSTRIAFFAQRKLKVVAAAGGPAETICDAPFARGGTWSRANVIVFAPDALGPLSRVPASGGTPERVTTLDANRGQQGHRFPFFLPDGDRFLFAALPSKNGVFDIFAGSVTNPANVTLVGSLDSSPSYVDPGWLVFVRQGVLAVQRFDAASLQLRGDPISLGDEPGVAPLPAAYDAGPRVSVATDASLAYYSPVSAATRLQWMDASGQLGSVLDVPAGRYTQVTLARDGKRAVIARADSGSASSLWLVDLARPGAVPLSTEGQNSTPVFSPDGKQVVFASDRKGGPREFYVKNTDDASPERKLATFDDRSAEPRGWSNDGTWIIFSRVDPGTRWNVYRLRAATGGDIEPLANGPSVELGGRLSPDDRWLAYLSDETGRFDLFVRSVAPNGPKVQVSTGGVQFGWWARDARQLLFTNRDDRTLWRVPIGLGAVPRLGTPQQAGTLAPGVMSIDMTPDERFLAIVADRSEGGSITVVQGWPPVSK